MQTNIQYNKRRHFVNHFFSCQCGFFVEEQVPGQIGEASPIPFKLSTNQVRYFEPLINHCKYYFIIYKIYNQCICLHICILMEGVLIIIFSEIAWLCDVKYANKHSLSDLARGNMQYINSSFVQHTLQHNYVYTYVYDITFQVPPEACLEQTEGNNTCQWICDQWGRGQVEAGWSLCDAPSDEVCFSYRYKLETFDIIFYYFGCDLLILNIQLFVIQLPLFH